MKGAASFFSWLGGIGYTILGFVLLSRGQTVAYTTYYSSGYYGYTYPQTSYHNVPYPTWVWVLWVIFVIFRLIILIWRQSAVESGNKVGCGVCTLLFVSLIGGILTLALPVTSSYSSHSSSSYSSSSSSSSSYSGYTPYSSSPTHSDDRKISWDQRNKEVEVHKQIYLKGAISKEEYERRVRELDARVYNKPAEEVIEEEKPKERPAADDFSLDDDEIADLIGKYKKLLDDGAITVDEYNEKKKQLLNMK